MEGGSSGSQARPDASTQQIFGMEDEDFQATQLNPGQRYANIETQQESQDRTIQDSYDSLASQLPLDSQSQSQLLQQQRSAGAGSDRSKSPRSRSGSGGAVPEAQANRISDSQDFFGENAPNQDATQIQIGGDEIAEDDDDLFGDGEDLFGDDPAGHGVAIKQEPGEEVAEQPPEEVEEVLNDDFLNLFGDEELPQLQAGPVPVDPASLDPAQQQKDDELDLFGEISDEEREEFAEKVSIRKREPLQEPIALFKVPQVIDFQKQAFDKKAALDALEHQWEEKDITGGASAIQLKNPENTYRWRFARDANGNIRYGDDDLPVYESNTRIVEFDDESKYLVLGDEYFKLTEKQEQNTRTHLFSEQEDNVFVYHKSINTQLGAVPLSINSQTHNKLMNAQIKKVAPDKRIMMVTKHQVAERQQRYLQDQEADKKLKRIQAGGAEKKAGKNILSADFLEGDDGGGLSLKKLKRDARHGDGFLEQTAKTLGAGSSKNK